MSDANEAVSLARRPRRRFDTPPACPICSAPSTRHGKRCEDCRGIHRTDGALVDSHTRYADDVAAQLFVAAYPDGATLEEVGDAFGVTKERIRQIENGALRHLESRLRLVGITAEDFMEVLMRRGARLAYGGEE
jgi:hypothetical protein